MTWRITSYTNPRDCAITLLNSDDTGALATGERSFARRAPEQASVRWGSEPTAGRGVVIGVL